MSSERAQGPMSCRTEPGLRSKEGCAQEPAFPHPTRTQHATLRNSGILYLNLAFHLVM